ncbi:10467_t:CDS:2, partial [Paraglomus brasilianum]
MAYEEVLFPVVFTGKSNYVGAMDINNNRTLHDIVEEILKEKNMRSKIPDPGERFSYVVANPERVFDLSVIKLKQPKADRMKFVDVAKDFDYATYTDLDEKYKRIDTHAQNEAKKWLESYIKEMNVVNGIDSKMMSARG